MNLTAIVIGALAGLFLLHSPIGALLGAIAGYVWQSGAFRLHGPRPGSGFIDPLFAFAGKLSKSDGRVSEREIAAAEQLMSRMRLDPTMRRAAIDRFNAGKQPDFDVAASIGQLRAWCGGRHDRAYLLLDLLLDLVYAEGPMVAAKLDLVRRLCAALGVSDSELAALSAMKGYAPHARHSGPRGPGPRARPAAIDPYAVLGVERDASERDIKRAYRKLMSQHHPDKLGDVPAELKQRAEERAREINAAYERIKSERGLR